MWGAPDDVLLAGVAVGDTDALAALTRRYQSRVFGLARAILGDAGAAEDVAQEAFIRVWRHAPAYDPRRGSAATWLLTITRNLAIDARRVRRPEPVDPDALCRMELPEPGRAGAPETSAEASDDAERLRAALARLPEEQRRALVLAAIGGRTAREISVSEGIPLGTAKTRIRSGFLRLQGALESRPDRR